MQPVFFIPHGGGPCFFMDWDPPDAWDAMRAFLGGLVTGLAEKPRAILVVTAHWETDRPMVTAQAAPALVYDYFGFPPHTYELKWPAPGDPELAGRVVSLLGDAGIDAGTETGRGFDHGVFIPMKVALPDADIPTVAMSLQKDLDPAFHIRVGRALAPLRKEGVLIVASGLSYHNMSAFRGGGEAEGAVTFDGWLHETLIAPPEDRESRLIAWADAPAARLAHPREEHLAPVFVAAGAARQDAAYRVYEDMAMGAKVSAWRFD